MRTWLIIALLTAVALSGCAGEDPDESVDYTGPSGDGDAAGGAGSDPSDGSGNATGETSGNGTSDAENGVPVLTVTADPVNGTAPLLVEFTLNVEDDSDSIAWAFLVDGDEVLTGDGVEAAFNHTFEEGAYNVTFQASDGEHSVTDALSITSVAAEPEPVLEDFSCTTTLGLGGPTLTGSVNFGGCGLTTIDAPRIVHSTDDPDGCDTQFNADGDNTRDGTVEPGVEYQPGTSFTAVCDAGVADVETTLVLEVPQEG